jgi:Fe-S-cluster containining protein
MLVPKIKQVEKLFKQLDHEIDRFKEKSKLKCLVGCSHCCENNEIYATVLEFLPMAKQVVMEHRENDVLDIIDSKVDNICVLFNKSSLGGCSYYNERGLICRLFGFSAIADKYSLLRLYTCGIIKETCSEAFIATSLAINHGTKVPLSNNFQSKLLYIDSELGREQFPINESIRRAISIVAFYYQNHHLNRHKMPRAS